MKSRDDRVRLEATKYYTARRMGWKETNVNEQVGKDAGPIETQDVSARGVNHGRHYVRKDGRKAGKVDLVSALALLMTLLAFLWIVLYRLLR
jgi:hypothetical protein